VFTAKSTDIRALQGSCEQGEQYIKDFCEIKESKGVYNMYTFLTLLNHIVYMANRVYFVHRMSETSVALRENL